VLWNDLARKRLLKLIKDSVPKLKGKNYAQVEVYIYDESKFYDCLPEEVDANVYAFEKTNHKFKK